MNDTKDFLKRQADLNNKLSILADDYATLMGDIKSDGSHFTGFRKIKETYFRLQALTLRNGGTAARKPREAGANHAIFQKTDLPASPRAPLGSPSKTAPDLFNRNRPPVGQEEEQSPKRVNLPAPNIFTKQPPAPAVPIRKAGKTAEPDNKRKVLASSEDKVKKGDD